MSSTQEFIEIYDVDVVDFVALKVVEDGETYYQLGITLVTFDEDEGKGPNFKTICTNAVYANLIDAAKSVQLYILSGLFDDAVVISNTTIVIDITAGETAGDEDEIDWQDYGVIFPDVRGRVETPADGYVN